MKKYYQINRNLIITSPNSSLKIMHVLKYCYMENATNDVNYTNFYTRVYTTVYFLVTKLTLSILSKIIIDKDETFSVY